MSTNLPPTGPPSGPPSGSPPSGPPPSGPPPGGPTSGPPSGPPPAGAAEVLEQGGGGPLPPDPPPTGSGGGRRKGLIIGGVIGLLALGGAAFGGYTWLTATGPQPAEALPADTLGYASIDLDPSGKQKIAFYNAAKKFPAAKEWLDDEGIGSGDDVRKFIFGKIQEEEGACEDVDFDDDIKPWLGDRFAVAAIPGEEGEPTPVGVVQLRDAEEGEDRVEKVIEECGGDPDAAGIALSGDWLIIAETDDIAEAVADDAAESNLADDAEFQKWTEAAGDPGIVSVYASADAGSVIAEEFAGFGGMLSSGDILECRPQLPGLDDSDEPFGTDDLADGCLEGEGLDTGPPEDDIADMFEEFGGMAMTVRFDDGSLEIEMASNTEGTGINSLTSSDHGSEAIATLPEDTAVAFGVGFEPGWFQEVLDYVEETSGGRLDIDEFLAQAADELDLSLPEDAETLFGESAVIAIGSDFDPEVVFGSMSGLSDLPVGLKIKGDPEEIQDVLDKIKATAPSPEDAKILSTESDDEYIVIGPSADYLSELLDDGELGDSDRFQDVVREDDASAIFYVDFDAGDGWLAQLAGDDEEAKEHLEPLAGLGATGWEDDGVGHLVLRVTTD